MGAPNETEVQKASRCVCARAPLDPCLLLRARTCTIDTQPYARAGGEIECSQTQRYGYVELSPRAAQEAIAHQCGHTMHAYVQSACLQKQPVIAPVLD